MRMNKAEMMEKIRGYFDSDTLLSELVEALSDIELYDNLEFICQMHDIPVFD